MSAEAAMAAQGGMQMLGSLFQGYTQAANLERSAHMSEINAQLYLRNASRIRLEAGLNEEAHRRAARRILGEQRAAIFESGTAASGSNLGVYDQSVIDSELDALNIRYSGDQQARQQQMEAAVATYEAGAARAGAKSARRAAWIGAGSAAVTSGSQYYSYKNDVSYRQQRLQADRDYNELLRVRGTGGMP